MDSWAFRSTWNVHVDGTVMRGTCMFRTLDRLEVEMQDCMLPEAERATIRSMLMHRVPSERNNLLDSIDSSLQGPDPTFHRADPGRTFRIGMQWSSGVE